MDGRKRSVRNTASISSMLCDEWYILAGQPFPPAEQYDGYLQLENGVGMMRLLLDEVKEEMENRTGDDRKQYRFPCNRTAGGTCHTADRRPALRKISERDHPHLSDPSTNFSVKRSRSPDF